MEIECHRVRLPWLDAPEVYAAYSTLLQGSGFLITVTTSTLYKGTYWSDIGVWAPDQYTWLVSEPSWAEFEPYVIYGLSDCRSIPPDLYMLDGCIGHIHRALVDRVGQRLVDQNREWMLELKGILGKIYG